MANEEHLAILRQGVKVWNNWRRENPNIRPNLVGADLVGTDLISVDFGLANLQTAALSRASMQGANLSKASMSGAGLRGTNLFRAEIQGADLVGTDLSETNLAWADLSESDLRIANLSIANLSITNVREANFSNTIFNHTLLTDIDLSVANNLHLARHQGPSTIGIDTLYKSKGNIPAEFLNGCGVPETMITFAKSLVGTAIEYYSCFISYSTKDDDFARQLNNRMKDKGLRVWFAPEEMQGGKKIHEQLYEAIRYHDKLILVLSEASMNSTWVQTEIKRARKHERDEKRRKLFPISLVPFGEIQKWELFDGDEGRDLAQEIREYYIPDFSHWKDYDKFTVEFEKLLRDLRADEQ